MRYDVSSRNVRSGSVATIGLLRPGRGPRPTRCVWSWKLGEGGAPSRFAPVMDARGMHRSVPRNPPPPLSIRKRSGSARQPLPARGFPASPIDCFSSPSAGTETRHPLPVLRVEGWYPHGIETHHPSIEIRPSPFLERKGGEVPIRSPRGETSTPRNPIDGIGISPEGLGASRTGPGVSGGPDEGPSGIVLDQGSGCRRNPRTIASRFISAAARPAAERGERRLDCGSDSASSSSPTRRT